MLLSGWKNLTNGMRNYFYADDLLAGNVANVGNAVGGIPNQYN